MYNIKLKKKYKLLLVQIIYRHFILFMAQQSLKPEDLSHSRHFCIVYKNINYMYNKVLITTNLQFNYCFISNTVDRPQYVTVITLVWIMHNTFFSL